MNTVKNLQSVEVDNLQTAATRDEIEAASYYEEKFVPALFQHWAPVIVNAVGVESGDRVLDVACGTGVVTRNIIELIGDGPVLSALDISAGMIEVARTFAPQVDWRVGNAIDLPYADNSFDRVVCQYGLMFFPDRVKALKEMRRVLKPGGRLAVSVWNTLENNPVIAGKVKILQDMVGSEAASALSMPFCLGELAPLEQMAEAAGIQRFEVQTQAGEACFTDLREFVDGELRGWLPIMNVHLEETQIQAIYEECQRWFSHYNDPIDHRFIMPTSAHIFTASV